MTGDFGPTVSGKQPIKWNRVWHCQQDFSWPSRLHRVPLVQRVQLDQWVLQGELDLQEIWWVSKICATVPQCNNNFMPSICARYLQGPTGPPGSPGMDGLPGMQGEKGARVRNTCFRILPKIVRLKWRWYTSSIAPQAGNLQVRNFMKIPYWYCFRTKNFCIFIFWMQQLIFKEALTQLQTSLWHCIPLPRTAALLPL